MSQEEIVEAAEISSTLFEPAPSEPRREVSERARMPNAEEGAEEEQARVPRKDIQSRLDFLSRMYASSRSQRTQEGGAGEEEPEGETMSPWEEDEEEEE
jgi:hypothetical protein